MLSQDLLDKTFEILIDKILNDKLPKYKIPRMINFVDNISTTKTGKVKR